MAWRWRLTERLALRGSYGLLCLGDVTRAPDGMDFARAASGAVQAGTRTDDLILHSIFVGFQLDA